VTSPFRNLREIAPQQLGPGYLARAVHGARVTFAVVEVAPHAELPEHSHGNEQLGIVLEGSVSFRIGEEERTIAAGGTWTIPPEVPHRVIGGEEGAVVLDVFAPAREEWKQLAAGAPCAPGWP
jgi:quercetin dioxygenase-like cupin family protein